MPQLELSLFGSIKCTLADDAVVQFAYDKVQALLAYLATESDRPHRREMLAGLLWPDQEESVARHNLNQALWSLRRSIGDHDAEEPVLLSTRESIRFNPEAGCTVEVRQFDALIRQVSQHVHRRPETCRFCVDWLAEAVGLYRGPFLEQFSVEGCPGFEEWVLVRREGFHLAAIRAIDRLVDYFDRQGEDQRAIAHLRRLLELDPWREDRHRHLMQLLARSGQRPAALAHFDRVRQILEQDLGADVEQETRDLRDEIECGEPIPKLSDLNLPNRTGPLARLPSQINPLIGRERVLRELGSLVSSGQHRLITLTGPGGIGKTRLALQMAHDESHTFANGACFVPLAGVESAGSLIQAIADARAITFYGNPNPRDQLLADLRGQDLLLVLDNFEHLLDGVDLLSDILAAAPDVQIVVTSREQLHLYGEYVFPVRALDIPSMNDDPGEIEQSGAVQLFVHSAERANSSFRSQLFDFPAIIHVCELVGGMPLGIELAAAWTPLLTCREIAQEIEQGLDFLTTSLRDVPDRHRSVRAAFDHSWRMLSDYERDVFMRLSVFHGGFQKDAAEQVVGTTLPVLLALMSKSFVTRNQVGRFEIHELLRQYAEDWLNQMPEKKVDACEAHARYYATFLYEREQRLKDRGHSLALKELIAESENVRASWNWALTRSQVDLLDTLVHVWLFYEVAGRYQECEHLQTDAIDILEQMEGDRSEVALARALSRRAAQRLRIGELAESEVALLTSNEILLRHGELAEVGLNSNFLAMKAHAEEDHNQEKRLLEESLRLTRLGGDQWTTAYSLNDLGLVECQLGDLDRAEALIQESFEIFNEIGDARGEAFALNNLGIVNCRRGMYEEATRLHRASLQVRRSLNNLWGAAQSLTQLGIVARLMDDYPESEARLREALSIASDLRAYPLLLDVLVEMAELLVLQGDQKRAFTIMARVAGHPASSPSITARVRHMRDTIGDTHFFVSSSGLGDPATISSLDDVITLVLCEQPDAPSTSVHSTVGTQRRHVVN